MPRWLANLIRATAQLSLRTASTLLQRDACQNLKRLRDILRNIELRCAFDVSRDGLRRDAMDLTKIE